MADIIAKKLEFPHCCVQLQAVCQLQSAAQKKLKEKKATKELDVLWKRCCFMENTEVSYACADVIITLTREGLLDGNKVISNSVNYASSAKNVSCLLYIISELLYAHAYKQTLYRCPYNLRAPPHPFISVITSRANSWSFVEFQIENMMEATDDFSPDILEMIRPAIFYILLTPLSTDEVILCRSRLLQSLFRTADKSAIQQQQDLFPTIFNTVLWPVLDFSTPDINTLGFYKELACKNAWKLHGHFAAIIILKMLKFCQDEPSLCARTAAVGCIKTIVSCLNGDGNELVFLGFAQSLGHFPLSVLHDILNTLNYFFETQKIGESVLALHLEVLRVSLLQLQLLVGTNSLQARTVSLLKKLFLKLEDIMQECRGEASHLQRYCNLFSTQDLLVTRIASISMLIRRISSEVSESATVWLDSVEQSLVHDSFSEDDVVTTEHIVAALFLNTVRCHRESTCGSDILPKISRCLCMLSKKHPKLSYSILPVVIYALKEAKGKVVQQICFILPSLASHPYCVAPILNIIKSLSADTSLKANALRLMLDLWKVQDRCYPHLQKMLTTFEIGVRKKNDSYDFNVIKAISISVICKERPHQYGSDMLKLLNPIVSGTCVGKCDIVIAAFALDGLYHLCKNKALNLITMWEQIGSILQGKPDGVIASKVLQILSLLPEFKSETSEYEALQDSILAWIWSRLESKDAVTVGAALSCLSHFDKEEFKVRHLPGSLRPEKPEDMADEEYLDKQISGSCILKLLRMTESSNLKDIELFLSSMISQELRDLPRDIHHRAMKSQLQVSQPKPLKAIPDFVMTFYEKNKQPTMKACLASSLLLCYSSTPELDSAGNAVPKSVVSEGRKSMDILQALLKEVTIEPNNWQNLIWCAHGWKVFMKKCLASMLEGRLAELVMQKARKPNDSEETKEDFEHKRKTALFWCRDKITNALKTASKGNPSMQGNAVFALVSLISAVSSAESSSEENAQDLDTEYVKTSHWMLMALDTIMSIASPKHIPSGRIMSWCQYRAVSSTGKLSTTQLGKICAIHALPFLASVSMQKHSGKVLEMLAYLRKNDPEYGGNVDFHRLLCLGHLLSVLYRENSIDQFGPDGSFLVQECLKMLHASVYKCVNEEEHPLQDDLGSLLGFGLALSSKFQTSDSSFNATGQAMLQQLLNHLVTEDLSSDSMQALSTMLTWTYLSGFASTILNVDDVKCLIQTLQAAVEDDPSKYGYCESLGTLCNGLFLCGDSTVVSVMDQLFDQWHTILNKGRIPTREKLAALAGFCALVGANTTLSPVAVDPTMLSSNHYLTKLSSVVKGLRQFSRASNDPGIPSRSIQILGHLYMSLESNSNAFGSILPASYDYLPSTSILKYVFGFISEMAKPDLSSQSELIEVAIHSVAANSWNYTLPPINWTSVVSVISTEKSSDAIKCGVVSVLLSQCANSPNCASLLTTLISPKKFEALPTDAALLMYRYLDRIIKCQEDLKIAEFLESLGTRCIELARQNVDDRDMCVAMLYGLAKALKVSSNLPPGISEMLHNTVERLFLHLPFSPQLKLQVVIMQKLAHCAEFLTDANALVGKFEKQGADPKDLLKSLFLRCCCTLNGTHSLSMCNNTILLCGENKVLRDDAFWIVSVCLRGVMKKIKAFNKIEWIQELMGQVKKILDFPQEGNIHLVEFLMNIFSIAIAFWSDTGSTLPIKGSFAEENVDISKCVAICMEECQLLPISICRLLSSKKWENMVQPIINWLSEIIGKLRKVAPEHPLIQQLTSAISASRNTKDYQLPSVWCKVVSTVYQV